MVFMTFLKGLLTISISTSQKPFSGPTMWQMELNMKSVTAHEKKLVIMVIITNCLLICTILVRKIKEEIENVKVP